jgi:hypothetical protein
MHDDLKHWETDGLLSPAEAQHTPIAYVPQFLSALEISSLLAELSAAEAAHAVGVVERDAGGEQADGGQWRTAYLHTGGFFPRRLGAVHAKIRAAMEAADAGAGGGDGTESSSGGSSGGGWGLLRGHDPASLHFRTVEVHRYGAGGRLGAARHFDGGSLLTMDVMLAEPGVDFDGGRFATPNADGSVSRVAHARFGRGDGVVFCSHKFHNVEPVTRGERRVLVAELWRGEEKACPHRCSCRGVAFGGGGGGADGGDGGDGGGEVCTYAPRWECERQCGFSSADYAAVEAHEARCVAAADDGQ